MPTEKRGMNTSECVIVRTPSHHTHTHTHTHTYTHTDVRPESPDFVEEDEAGLVGRAGRARPGALPKLKKTVIDDDDGDVKRGVKEVKKEASAVGQQSAVDRAGNFFFFYCLMFLPFTFLFIYSHPFIHTIPSISTSRIATREQGRLGRRCQSGSVHSK